MNLNLLLKIKKEKMFEIFYVLSLSIAFLSRLGKFYSVNYFVSVFIASGWSLFLIFDLYKNNKLHLINFKKWLTHKKASLLLFPILAICIYNFFLLFIGKIDVIFIGRCISNLYMMLITVTSAIAGLYFFKQKMLKLIIKAVILNFSFIIILNIILYGTDCFYQLYLSISGNVQALNPFEVHDLTFGAGVLLIFLYLNEKGIDVKKRALLISFMTIIILLGFKRIQILTLFVCLIAGIVIIILKKHKKNIYKFCMITSILLVLFSFIYIWLIDSKTLLMICKSLNIETMGRLTLYDWVSQYYEFNPFYLGIGSGTTFKMLETTTTWGIAAIHSDILRMFVETGFLMFTFWLVYYNIFLLKHIFKNTYENSGVIYYMITLYLFMIYFTDNTLLYYGTQFIYISCVLQILEYKSIKLYY